MKNKTLYGKTSSGAVKVWSIKVEENADGTCCIIMQHGQLNGKMQEDSRTISCGKNIGKANETTVLEQALSEAKALMIKKVDQGYVEDVSLITEYSEAERWLPMLANVWEDAVSHVKFPGYVQAKLDGSRLLAEKQNGTVRMWSRQGKEITIPHLIKKELEGVLSDGECTDGELYVHGWSFQRNISAVKKYSADTDLLEYHIYDLPNKNGMSFKDRFVDIDKSKFTGRLKILPTTPVSSMEDISAAEVLALQEGYEGLMFRNSKGVYKFKHRSSDLLKIKRFTDSEFEIIGSKDGTGREEGLIIFRCKNEAGKEFDVRPAGTVEERARMWHNRASLLGKLLTVKYQEFTDDGLPRFPVGLHIREEWDR